MLPIMARMVHQQRRDQSKGYSLHEPAVSCIAKGKAPKKDALGSKVSGNHVVVRVVNFAGNPHDRKTLAPTLDPVAQWTGRRYELVWVEKGYRGHAQVGSTTVSMPGKKVHASTYALRRHQTLCKRHSAIEVMIGHLKSEHRLGRNTDPCMANLQFKAHCNSFMLLPIA
jgi:transposase, IS5 family